MTFLLPFVSAAAGAFGSAFDKLNLSRHGFKPRALLLLTFAVMFATVGGYVVFAKPVLPAFSGIVITVMSVIVMLSFAQNIFELKGIQAMQLHTREPIITLEPILTGILAYLIFPSEGNILYLAAIIIGVPIVYWSTASKGHSWRSMFTAGSALVFAEISLSALIDNASKFALYFIAPAYLALFRSGGVLLLSCAFFSASWKQVPRGAILLGILPGILFAVGALAKMSAIEHLGLNVTILVMLLQPGLIYLLSRLMLKEKLEWRPIMGSVAIVLLLLAIHIP